MTRDEIAEAVRTARVRFARSANTGERTLMVFERVNERGNTIDAYGLVDTAEGYPQESTEAWCDWPGLVDALEEEGEAIRAALSALPREEHEYQSIPEMRLGVWISNGPTKRGAAKARKILQRHGLTALYVRAATA